MATGGCVVDSRPVQPIQPRRVAVAAPGAGSVEAATLGVMGNESRPDWAEVATSQLLNDAVAKATKSQRPYTARWLRYVIESGTEAQRTAAIGVAEIILGEKA